MTRRFLLPTVALALAAAGCGGGGETASPPPPQAGGTAETSGDDVLAVSKDGWKTNFSKHTVSLSEFASGGPGKDDIPAIDRPAFTTVEEASEWIAPREPVIELDLNGEARAYPIQILVWHEIVNDTVAETPVAVTFCPLCNTALVFDRRLGEQVLDFGTTGNLRNSDLVMYDRQTETWWQQFGGEAVVGELAGRKLRHVPARIVAWEDFASAHSDGQVLDRPRTAEGRLVRSYGENPYAGYDDIDSPPFFPAAGSGDRRLAPKERVVFVERGDEAVVVPFSILARKKTVEIELDGRRLEVGWVPGAGSSLDTADIGEGREVGSAEVRAVSTGKLVPFDTPFWFAVAAFRPDVRIVR